LHPAAAFPSEWAIIQPTITFFRSVAQITRKTRLPSVATVLQSWWTAAIALSGSYE
jgi:hypothetical protein